MLEALVSAIAARNVHHIGSVLHPLPPEQQRSLIGSALAQLAKADPDSVYWFIRHALTSEAREQLRQGLYQTVLANLQASGREFLWRDGMLVLTRSALLDAVAEADPLAELLVSEFCQLQE